MKVSVIAIGDELLIGQVTDTNTGTIARIIEPAGWTVEYGQTVPDSASEIKLAIDRAFEKTDVVLTTGGLGPTKDDITKATLRDYFGGEMVVDQSVVENIKQVFAKRGLKLNHLTEAQAVVPSSCRVIQNLVGTAPIMWFERDGKVLVSMPGVPFEMEQMFRSAVFPALSQRFHSDVSVSRRVVIISGMTESGVAMVLDEWERALPPFVHLAYLPKPGIIRLRLDGAHHDSALLDATLDRLKAELLDRFADNILADDDLTPEEVLLTALREHGLTVATAESCTGGNIAHRITAIAGCSDVYLGSVVSYANDVKISILGVDPALIERYGVVSEPVAAAMALGACRAVGADCAIATSGIAGPGGATPGKPVGTVCAAICIKDETRTVTYHLPGTRDRVIDRASTNTLVWLAAELTHPTK